MAEVAVEKRFEIEVRDLEYQRMDGVPAPAILVCPLKLDLAWFFGAARLAERPRLFGGGAQPAPSRLDAVVQRHGKRQQRGCAETEQEWQIGAFERHKARESAGPTNNEDRGQTVAARKHGTSRPLEADG